MQSEQKPALYLIGSGLVVLGVLCLIYSMPFIVALFIAGGAYLMQGVLNKFIYGYLFEIRAKPEHSHIWGVSLLTYAVGLFVIGAMLTVISFESVQSSGLAIFGAYFLIGGLHFTVIYAKAMRLKDSP